MNGFEPFNLVFMYKFIRKSSHLFAPKFWKIDEEKMDQYIDHLN